MTYKVLFVILCIICCSQAVIYSGIPTHLHDCYQNGGVNVTAPRRLDVFLNILRKLENNVRLDLRLFSTALLRRFRLDGIEHSANPIEIENVIPFRASAFQFQKYKLMMDLFLPSQNVVDMDENLTVHERCLLHTMLSSTVHRWERGDEDSVCPMSVQHRQSPLTADPKTGRGFSRCPIEDGVVQSEWGSLAPGIIVAAIAASLESQSVLLTDAINTDVFRTNILAEPLDPSPQSQVEIETLDEVIKMPRIAGAEISNIWVATLAGDLAEVAVNQGPRVGSFSQMTVGSNNRWNDTLLPRANYLLSQYLSSITWHMTDTEILSGIDGMILANEVPKWISQRASLRLSQIFEMYYSDLGVSFDPTIRACNRQQNFNSIFVRSELLTQMSNFAQLLSLSQGSVIIPVEEMDKMCEAAVTAFVSYVPSVLSLNQRHCADAIEVPSMNIIVTTDGSWKRYETEQFVSWLGRAADISAARSQLALLHGGSARWVASPAQDLVAFFADLHAFTDDWPNRLNFPEVLSTLIEHLHERTDEEASSGVSVVRPTVVLVISPGDRLSSADLERSRELMTSLKWNFFDVYFVFVAQDVTSFQNLNTDFLDYSDKFLEVSSTAVKDIIASVNQEIITVQVPKRIIGQHCDVNGTSFPQSLYEDYVLSKQENRYRIHPYYLQGQSDVSVHFRAMSMGEVQVCWWSGGEGTRSCQPLPSLERVAVNLTTPCPSAAFCPPAHFAVTGTSALNNCANTACRLPNHIGYYIEHSGLRCLSRHSGDARLFQNEYLLLLQFFLIYIFQACT